jgi:hypothetical protein
MWDQKTVSLEWFPKFWRKPKPQGVVGGCKKIGKRMAIQSIAMARREVGEPKE